MVVGRHAEWIHGLRRRQAAPGKASFNDFNFTHHIDKATPLLLKACATGTHIPDGTITVRKAGKGQQEYLIIKMTDVLDHERRDERGRGRAQPPPKT